MVRDPGHFWEEGRQVVDQVMQQIKVIVFVQLVVQTPRLLLLPWSCLSEREETAHLPTGCSRNCREATLAGLVLVCKMLNLVGKSGGEMKGWPANHSGDSFARVRLGRGPALPLSQGSPFCRQLPCRNPTGSPVLREGAWKKSGSSLSPLL